MDRIAWMEKGCIERCSMNAGLSPRGTIIPKVESFLGPILISTFLGFTRPAVWRRQLMRRGVIKDFKCWVFGIATANCQNCEECSGSNILFVWFFFFFFSPLYNLRGFCVLLWSARKDRPRGYKPAGSGSYALINGYYDTDTEVSQTELRIGYGKPRHRFGCIYLYRDMIFLPKNSVSEQSLHGSF